MGFSGVVARFLVSPFECGFDSQGFGRRFFSVRFSYFVLLFLCFDIELVWFFGFPVFIGIKLFLLCILFGYVVFSYLVEESAMIWDVSGFCLGFLILWLSCAQARCCLLLWFFCLVSFGFLGFLSWVFGFGLSYVFCVV